MIHAVPKCTAESSAAENTVVRSLAPFRAWRRPAMRSVLGLAVLLGIPVAGQSPLPQVPAKDSAKFGQQFPDTSGLYDQNPNSPNQKRMQVLNVQRQKAIVSETEKLLELARELNDDVAASNSERMSDDQMHKVAEIGKLAKSVKDKMSYSLGGYPALNTPLTIAPVVQ